MLKHIHFAKSEWQFKRDGMHTSELGVGPMETGILMALKKFPWLQTVIGKFGAGPSAKALTERNLKDASVAVFFGSSLRHSDLLQAGQNAMRTWLSATLNGFAVQPITIGSLIMTEAHLAPHLLSFKKDEMEFLRSGLNLWQLATGLNGVFPLWALRVGKPRVVQNPKSLRRELEHHLRTEGSSDINSEWVSQKKKEVRTA